MKRDAPGVEVSENQRWKAGTVGIECTTEDE